MIELEKFPCYCEKCFCLNELYQPNKVCTECSSGKHEGPKK